ncbi:MAG: hypothetical protein P8014_03550 [Acidihalobacter sp.]|uniref:hypothetical protein n=1 Tax=Acidihalobacter sp. TaxID=1872108 RepID=UPI00307F7DBA
MTLFEAPANRRLLGGGLVYALGTAAAPLGLEWLRQHAEHAALGAWILRYLGRPLAHALLLVAFVLIALPALLGLAYPLNPAKVTGGGSHLGALINLATLLALALPWVARPAGLQALLLPLQTAALLMLIAHWLATAPLDYLPDPVSALLFVVLAWAGYRLSRLFGQALGGIVDRHWAVTGSGLIIGEALLPLFQAPGVIAYGLTLGRQLLT